MPGKTIERFGTRIAHEAQESEQDGVTVIAFGRMIYTALKAARRAKPHVIHVEVLALRTLTPLPLDEIVQSVKKTKRLVMVEEAPVSGGFGEHLVAKVTNDPTMLVTLWTTPRGVLATSVVQQRMVDMTLNGRGGRDTACVLGVSPPTVIDTFKKKSQHYSKEISDFSRLSILHWFAYGRAICTIDQLIWNTTAHPTRARTAARLAWQEETL